MLVVHSPAWLEMRWVANLQGKHSLQQSPVGQAGSLAECWGLLDLNLA